jgi:hypothetical protein
MGYLVTFMKLVSSAVPRSAPNRPEEEVEGILDTFGPGPETESFKVKFHHSCKFLINGKAEKSPNVPFTVEDLRQGDKLEVDGQPAVLIKVHRPK